MAAPNFGTDISTFPALDTTFSTISGYRVLSEALTRRLLTRKGLLVFHPDYGIDLRAYLNEAVTDDMLFRLKTEALAEIQQDERVDSATASVTFDPTTSRLTLTFQVQTAAGPFSFVLGVSQLSVDLYTGV